jgi:hypothetical protein
MIVRRFRDFSFRDFHIANSSAKFHLPHVLIPWSALAVESFLDALHVAIRETPIWSMINGPDLISI